MPAKVNLFPHICRFNPASSLPSFIFSTMKLNPTSKASRAVPIFSRMFPHKLKYHSFSQRLWFPSPPAQLSCHNELSVRRLSTRSSRSRSASGSEVQGSRSLIDDEAELSDWVGGLSSSSYRSQLNSDREDDREKRNIGRKVPKGVDERAGKRRRDSDDYGVSRSRRSRGRDSFGPVSGNLRAKGPAFGRERGQGGGGGLRPGVNGGGRRAFMISDEDDGEGNDDDCGRSRPGNQIRSRNSFSGNSRGKGPTLARESDGHAGRLRGRKAKTIELDSSDDVEESEVEEKDLSLKDFMSEDESDEDADEDEDESDEDADEDEDEDENEDVLKIGNSFRRMESEDGLPISSRASYSDSYLSETRFDQCSISPLSLKGIKDAKYEKLTVVQEATLPVILKGKDVLAKAKTGTGKTVAFLLPSIEVIVKSPPISRDQKRPPILVLVVCPTRELASQAASEANTLLKYHPTIGVQVVIGGTRLALEQKRMQTNPCQILVATPGRLRDHIENTAGFASRLMGVKVLVLDEADHLLDMGFRKDIEKIIDAVPKQRQTLLFSATVPEEVRQISHIALKRDHEFISTVQEGTEETHSQVKQTYLVSPLEKHFSLLYVILKEHIADNVDYKVLVFCTTAMVTKLVAELLGQLNLNIREIHSRKAQTYRTRVSDEFRKSKGLILVTSDVSARGVDYPDVTLVIQVGLPADREQYIHRLGRTGRKGKEGLGILLLAPWEEFFLSTVKDLPITKAPLPSVDPDNKRKVERALSHVEMKSKESAYQAWLGYYNSSKGVGRDKYRLVELANEFSRSMGLDNPPAIPKLVLSKMGLRNIPGLRSR